VSYAGSPSIPVAQPQRDFRASVHPVFCMRRPAVCHGDGISHRQPETGSPVISTHRAKALPGYLRCTTSTDHPAASAANHPSAASHTLRGHTTRPVRQPSMRAARPALSWAKQPRRTTRRPRAGSVSGALRSPADRQRLLATWVPGRRFGRGARRLAHPAMV